MHCTRMKKVYSRVYRKRVRRCAKFSGRPRKSRSSSRRSYSSSGRRRLYRKSRPFNKGKRCKAWGYRLDVRTGRSKRYCRSFGSTSAWRSRKGRKYPPLHKPSAIERVMHTGGGQRIQVRYAQPYPEAPRPVFFRRLLGSGS